MTGRPTATRRATGAALVAAVLCLGAAGLGACGVPLDEEPRPLTAATLPPETTPTTSASPTAQEVSVYYLVGDHLEVVRYPVDGDPSLDAALGFLLSSQPTGLAKSVIPPGTSLRSVRVVDDLATIDLSSEIVDDTSGEIQKQAFAQIAFTALASEGVNQVQFEVEGERVEVPTDRANQSTITADDYDPPLNPR